MDIWMGWSEGLQWWRVKQVPAREKTASWAIRGRGSAVRCRLTCLRLLFGVMVAVRCRGPDSLKREVVGGAAEEDLVGCGQPLQRQARWSTGLKRDLVASYSYPTYIYYRYHPFIFVGQERMWAWKFLLHLDVCVCWRSCRLSWPHC